jgi:hypothetical protein
MIGITTKDGKLRIQAEISIPNAEAGQWSPARIGKLIETIQQTVDVAEMVDGEGGLNYGQSEASNRRNERVSATEL